MGQGQDLCAVSYSQVKLVSELDNGIEIPEHMDGQTDRRGETSFNPFPFVGGRNNEAPFIPKSQLTVMKIALTTQFPKHELQKTFLNLHLISLPNSKILDFMKLKAFAEDKLNVAKMSISLFDRVKKCWLLAFSPFPTVFSKSFFFRVINPFPHNDTF